MRRYVYGIARGYFPGLIFYDHEALAADKIIALFRLMIVNRLLRSDRYFGNLN